MSVPSASESFPPNPEVLSGSPAPAELTLVLDKEPFSFQTHFTGLMEMYSPLETVSSYLDAHQGWFSRCACPMEAEPLGDNAYTLTIGRFGSFGYEVEPKMSVAFEVSPDQTYLMYSIPVPNYQTPGYSVDYQASMVLAEIPLEASSAVQSNYYQQLATTAIKMATKVSWELHLKVLVQFPSFIYKLPTKVIQNTGDRLLTEIVRQISPRLTYKVQQDFHSQFNLPVPPKASRSLTRI